MPTETTQRIVEPPHPQGDGQALGDPQLAKVLRAQFGAHAVAHGPVGAEHRRDPPANVYCGAALVVEAGAEGGADVTLQVCGGGMDGTNNNMRPGGLCPSCRWLNCIDFAGQFDRMLLFVPAVPTSSWMFERGRMGSHQRFIIQVTLSSTCDLP